MINWNKSIEKREKYTVAHKTSLKKERKNFTAAE